MADSELRRHLIAMLTEANAHLAYETVLANFPASLRGKSVGGFEHTAWQLLEHLRLAQWDILEFSTNPSHVSPDFPDGYWPKTSAPESDREWKESVGTFLRDRDDMVMLIGDETVNLLAAIPHGDGQTVLREALVLAKHNSYHLGQLVLLHKALISR